MKAIQRGEKLPLRLTASERSLITTDVMSLDKTSEQLIKETPVNEPVMMTLDDLDEFHGYLAAESNHCNDRVKQKKLDAVLRKVSKLLETYTDE